MLSGKLGKHVLGKFLYNAVFCAQAADRVSIADRRLMQMQRRKFFLIDFPSYSASGMF